YINRLLVKIRPHALDLVDAFGYGPEHLRAAIATGAEQVRQDEARAYFRTQRASGAAPVDERVLLARKPGVAAR
ncbi:MAG: acyl-CoA dehydrogenase, partial [Arthrobacter sp.]